MMTPKEYTDFQVKRHEKDKAIAHEICCEFVGIMTQRKINRRIYSIIKEQLDNFVTDSPLEFVEYPKEYF